MVNQNSRSEGEACRVTVSGHAYRRMGTHKVSTAPVSATPATTQNDAVKDPVRVFRYANTYGDANDDMFPRVLIIPTAAAAADRLRISVGIEKNTEM